MLPRRVRRRGERDSEPGSDNGSVAAELAVALPAVVLTLLLGAGALSAAAQLVTLQDAVADGARLLGRGESSAVAYGAVTASATGASVSSQQRGDLICVTAQLDVAVGSFVRMPLSASSCALSGGL